MSDRTTISAVEFVGGPHDGLRLLDGLEDFAAIMAQEMLVTVDHGITFYRPRRRLVDGVLFMDHLDVPAARRANDG